MQKISFNLINFTPNCSDKNCSNQSGLSFKQRKVYTEIGKRAHLEGEIKFCEKKLASLTASLEKDKTDGLRRKHERAIEAIKKMMISTQQKLDALLKS